MDIRERLGNNVRRLRLEKGWSQEDYADRAGIHRTYVSDIERGGWESDRYGGGEACEVARHQIRKPARLVLCAYHELHCS